MKDQRYRATPQFAFLKSIPERLLMLGPLFLLYINKFVIANRCAPRKRLILVSTTWSLLLWLETLGELIWRQRQPWTDLNSVKSVGAPFTLDHSTRHIALSLLRNETKSCAMFCTTPNNCRLIELWLCRPGEGDGHLTQRVVPSCVREEELKVSGVLLWVVLCAVLWCHSNGSFHSSLSCHQALSSGSNSTDIFRNKLPHRHRMLPSTVGPTVTEKRHEWGILWPSHWNLDEKNDKYKEPRSRVKHDSLYFCLWKVRKLEPNRVSKDFFRIRTYSTTKKFFFSTWRELSETSSLSFCYVRYP